MKYNHKAITTTSTAALAAIRPSRPSRNPAAPSPRPGPGWPVGTKLPGFRILHGFQEMRFWTRLEITVDYRDATIESPDPKKEMEHEAYRGSYIWMVSQAIYRQCFELPPSERPDVEIVIGGARWWASLQGRRCGVYRFLTTPQEWQSTCRLASRLEVTPAEMVRYIVNDAKPSWRV